MVSTRYATTISIFIRFIIVGHGVSLHFVATISIVIRYSVVGHSFYLAQVGKAHINRLPFHIVPSVSTACNERS